jgi:N-acetylmuramoyl-L-alanine amidase
MRQLLSLLALVMLCVFSAQAAEAAPDSSTVLLKELAALYGFPSVIGTNNTMRWKSKYSSLAFHLDSRRLIFNHRLFWLNGGAIIRGKDWCISQTDAETVILPLLQSEKVLRSQGFGMVVLDAGHGGSDTGAIVPGKLEEKKVVLDIAHLVKKKLNASNVPVRMTRTKDVALTLKQRPKLAERWGADLFVSIHANEAPNKAANGIETYVIPAAGFPSTSSTKPNSESYRGNRCDAANTLLGGYINQGVVTQTGAPDRGVKRARFSVLREAPCPAALVEVGFVSNAAERANLLKPEYRDRIAEGIAQGILTYLIKAEASQR